MEQELDAVKQLHKPGSDEMTTRAAREGGQIALRSSYTTLLNVNGEPPWLVIEQSQRLSLSPLGQLVVETDRIATEKTGRITKSRNRLVYARAKTFDWLIDQLSGNSREQDAAEGGHIKYIDTSIHRYIDTSIHRYIDTSIHRYIDTSIHRYIDRSIES
jgi:hypothetical protein